MIDKELIFHQLNITDFQTVIEEMGKKMQELGYVKDSYIGAVIEREKNTPTGLEMNEYGIAIPHTDKEHVNESIISVATLKNSVTVYSMIDPTKPIEIQLIILMAIKDPNGQVKMLGNLMGLFQDVTTLQALENAENEEEMYSIISKLGLNSEEVIQDLKK